MLLSTVLPINAEEDLDFNNFPHTIEGPEVNIIKDGELRTFVIEMLSAESKISFPKSSNNRYLVLQFRYQSKFLSFSINLVDSNNVNRTIVASNSRSTVKISKEDASIPLVLSSNTWQIVKIDLEDVLKRCFGTSFVESKFITVEGITRLSKIYFEGEDYSDAQLPKFLRVVGNAII